MKIESAVNILIKRLEKSLLGEKEKLDKGELQLIKIIDKCDVKKKGEIIYLISLCFVDDIHYEINELTFSTLLSCIDKGEELDFSLEDIVPSNGGIFH